MRSPCSFAVRMRAMTCGRLTRVSSSSSARSRASPSGVRASAATTGAGRSRFRRDRAADFAARGARGAADTAFRRGRFAPSTICVAVGHADHTCRGQRRGDRLGDEGAGQTRSPCARPSRCGGSPTGGRRCGRGGRARSASGTPAAKAASRASSYSSVAAVAAHQTLSPSSERSVLSQCPPAAGRRSPSSVLAIAATRRADGHLGRPDVEDGLRRQPERRETRGHGFRCRYARRRGGASRPVRSTCRRGSARSAPSPAGRAASTTKTPGPWAWTGRPQTAGPSAMRPTERRSAGAVSVLGHRPMVQVTRSRYGSAVMSRRRHS